jgi:hypothetical protein
MEEIRQYVISIVTAAIICGGITSLVGKKNAVGGIVKFLCGLFMTITAISPWVSLRLPNELTFWDTIQAEAQAASSEGEQIGAEMRSAIITEQLETYVLEKAESLDLTISAEITLNESFLPELVIIQGAASPYARSRLCNYISDNLGISEDRVKWT